MPRRVRQKRFAVCSTRVILHRKEIAFVILHGMTCID